MVSVVCLGLFDYLLGLFVFLLGLFDFLLGLFVFLCVFQCFCLNVLCCFYMVTNWGNQWFVSTSSFELMGNAQLCK